MKSEQINELVAALINVQKELKAVNKDAENPFFKSQYATLTAVWEAIREPLTKNNLTVIQTTKEAKDGVLLVTTLAHISGQYIQGELFMKPKEFTAQGVGSCITYARRYALAAILGVTQDDDDGNGAVNDKVIEFVNKIKTADTPVRLQQLRVQLNDQVNKKILVLKQKGIDLLQDEIYQAEKRLKVNHESD
jgi:hypothetical protein